MGRPRRRTRITLPGGATVARSAWVEPGTTRLPDGYTPPPASLAPPTPEPCCPCTRECTCPCHADDEGGRR